MDNISKELKVIQDLMDELQEQMQYGKEDFEHRLGRNKPQIEAIKIEGEIPSEPEGLEEVISEESLQEDESDEDLDSELMELEEESPEDSLKKRLMKLRG